MKGGAPNDFAFKSWIGGFQKSNDSNACDIVFKLISANNLSLFIRMLYRYVEIRFSYDNLVVALVLTHVDYGNATLAGFADQSLVKLQSVLNTAARLMFLSRKFDHVTPLLRESHCLCFPERIYYKLALLVFKSQWQSG